MAPAIGRRLCSQLDGRSPSWAVPTRGSLGVGVARNGLGSVTMAEIQGERLSLGLLL